MESSSTKQILYSDRLARKLPSGARSRAKRAKKGEVPFSLTATEVEALWQLCEGRCSVSGIPFNAKAYDHALVKHPFAPSLDRIKPAKGYVRANVRLVVVAANFGMNEWGFEVLETVAQGVAGQRYRKGVRVEYPPA